MSVSPWHKLSDRSVRWAVVHRFTNLIIQIYSRCVISQIKSSHVAVTAGMFQSYHGRVNQCHHLWKVCWSSRKGRRCSWKFIQSVPRTLLIWNTCNSATQHLDLIMPRTNTGQQLLKHKPHPVMLQHLPCSQHIHSLWAVTVTLGAKGCVHWLKTATRTKVHHKHLEKTRK